VAQAAVNGLTSGYFNYWSHVAEGWWGRRSFLHKWRRLYTGDRRWVPSHYPTLYRLLPPGQSPHLARLRPTLLYIEAIAGRRSQGGMMASIMEEPVSATVVLADRRRGDDTAYLGLLHTVNDEESLERLLSLALEHAFASGCYRLIGPTALSPHLGSGVLQDHFHLTPPLHTPYNPPYLPELAGSLMNPLVHARLYHAEVPSSAQDAAGPAEIVPLETARLATDLLLLLAEACRAWAEFPPPDAVEAELMLQWLQVWPVESWGAVVDGQVVGFVMLQPDLAPAVLRAQGGRNLLWRMWLNWRSRRPVRAGRLLHMAVLPEHQGQGVGQQLWRRTLAAAARAGWRTLTAGPYPDDSPAAAFLTAMGATPQQRYIVYESEL
jgi:GNAT superfamily N-acetyltransferase